MNRNGHHAHKDFDTDQLSAIVGRYVRGESAASIAEDLDVTDNTIRYHLRQLGIEMRDTGNRNTPGSNLKWCGRCQQMLPKSAFGRYHKRKDGLNTYCRKCVNAYANKARVQSAYGISMQEFEKMLAAQGGGCAICGKKIDDRRDGKTRRLCVDHDHDTGRIRGILCTRCNTGIGMFGNDPDLFRRAINYLSQEG